MELIILNYQCNAVGQANGVSASVNELNNINQLILFNEMKGK